MVFLDSSAVPFDDLEYAEVNEFWDAQSSKFPLIFVSIQGSPMLPPRVVRPTPEELEWMTMLISALGQTEKMGSEEVVEREGIRMHVKERLDGSAV
mmetsp:Transcript_7010/g.30807  ORF Transcript_7010/g.30807 Transcript_7010/m.30807 type:complete len:96 (-) Transcript_7010:4099-4386(-)